MNLGIDIAKAKFDCALRLADGKYRHKVFANDNQGFAALTEWLDKHGANVVHACNGNHGRVLASVGRIPGQPWHARQRGQSGADQGVRSVTHGAHQNRQGRCKVDRRLLP